jgi:phenylalanyl-tRNA synthetase alpha chain
MSLELDTMAFDSDILALETALIQEIADARSLEALESCRVRALGKKGEITVRLKALSLMDMDSRRVQGPLLQNLRTHILEALDSRKSALQQSALSAQLESEKVDVSLPVSISRELRGRIHPLSFVIDEVIALFATLGFSVEEGPDVENDFYNFTALNFSEDHPARDMHDTFFLQNQDGEEQKLLRTHTSPVQIRTLLRAEPPLRIVCPGRTYRRDSDQTHTPMFHQIEGLVIDKHVHMGHMKHVLETFCRTYFQTPDLQLRFRPSYFPFTEPSLEVDISCSRKEGKISIGKGDQWLEILGCGMVHPQVLRNCGLNPEEWQGFAWGLGLDRIAMLKYGMPDLRAFFEADVRWLAHYGFSLFDSSEAVL